jgi:hypothetical protein
MQIRNGTLQLRIDDSNARYPLRIDPFIQQGEKLTGAGESGEGHFGESVALSSDGNTALIGGPRNNNGLEGVGAAWVFTRSGSTWTQQAKLTGEEESGGGEFGKSVALSADGNTALIGGPSDNNGAVGAAWVFTRSSSTWTQQGAKLTGSGESGEGRFGWSVALSSEGNTVLIGGYQDNGFVGAAWVFTRSGSTWTQQGKKLTGSGEIGGGLFGWSVALSSEGNTALIGGWGDNEGGAAWVFTRSGSTWTQQGAKLTGSGEIGDGGFGNSVALSSDGNTALIGGENDREFIGAAWVFTRSSATWTQQGKKLTGSGEVGHGGFGRSVALSPEGNTALIGGHEDNSGIGAAWVFTRSGSTWTQQGEKLTGSGESGKGKFGRSVALSSEGNAALIGGHEDNSSVGAAWVFVNQPAPMVETCTASPVTQSTARLCAIVNPSGAQVSKCEFEYGTTTSYGSSVPCAPSPGSGTSPVEVFASVTGLTANTTYHFRISATNPGGTSIGGDQAFTTLTAPHWYVNGKLLAEGKKVAVVTWGTLELKSAVGPVTCHSSGGSYVENPNGGGNGVDLVESFRPFFECKDPGCPPPFVIKVVPSGGISTGINTFPGSGWPSTLFRTTKTVEGEETPIIRDRTEDIVISIICESPEHKVELELPFSGANEPEEVNGTAASKPSLSEFGAGSGHLESIDGPGETIGKDKMMGYEEEEVITTK